MFYGKPTQEEKTAAQKIIAGLLEHTFINNKRDENEQAASASLIVRLLEAWKPQNQWYIYTVESETGGKAAVIGIYPLPGNYPDPANEKIFFGDWDEIAEQIIAWVEK